MGIVLLMYSQVQYQEYNLQSGYMQCNHWTDGVWKKIKNP